eukprot:gene11535-7955_t
MLTILDVVKNVFSYDYSHTPKALLPSEESLKKLPYVLSDFATMTGRERVAVLSEANIDPLLYPVFIRAIQHLTSAYGAGSIEDSYRLHRHVSAHAWAGSYSCPLLGFANVNSSAYRNESILAPRHNDSSDHRLTTVPSTETGHVNGLVNQGATCYLNSLLQSLFHLSEFRAIIYNMPTREEADLNCGSSLNMDRLKETISIPYALQRLFCRLQTGNSAADTTELTASFGWSASDGFVQHDVHELMQVLLNNLEAKLSVQNGTGANSGSRNAISSLFRGTLENFVRVEEANYYGASEEPFNSFFQVEVLDGKNRYCLERDGQRTYHRAEKGVRLKATPPVLLLHLTRFDYNMQYGESKVFTKWAYYNTLDLSRYMPHLTPHDTHYTLYSVLVHFGSNTGHGHYYCFLRCGGVWYKFNDEYVTPAKLTEVFGSNFGGFTMNYWGSEVPHMNSAYLLVYIRTSEIHNLLRPISTKDLPAHVVEQLTVEEQERLRIEKELSEDHLYGRVKFAFPQEVVDHTELYYGRPAANLHIPSHRTARLHLDEDLLNGCLEFLKQKKLCTAEELRSVMLWYPDIAGRRASESFPVHLDSRSGEPEAPLTESASTGGTGHLRLCGRIEPGMKPRDIVAGGKSCIVLLTTASTVPIVDLTDVEKEQEVSTTEEQPTDLLSEPIHCEKEAAEYQIFHHKLYDPIHLRVISLGSTIVRRYPHAPIQHTLKCLESIIQELVGKLALDDEERELLNHDHKYDAARRKLDKATGRLHPTHGDGTPTKASGNSVTAPPGSTNGKLSAAKNPSSTLLFDAANTASRLSMTPSVSQADDLDAFFTDFIAVPPPTNIGNAEAPQPPLFQPIRSSSPPPPINTEESGGTALSVHVEEDDNAYTLLHHWEDDDLLYQSNRGSQSHDPNSPGPAVSSSNSKALVASNRQRWRHREMLLSGDIFVWQTPVRPCDPNVFFADIIAFQQFLQAPVSVTIRLNRPPECPPLIQATLSEIMTYEQLQRYVARLIGESDYDRIRFTRHNPDTEQPYFMKGTKADLATLRQLLGLGPHRVPSSASFVYYERCKYPVSQVEKAHSLQFQLFSESVKAVSSHWILLPLDEPITKMSFFKAVIEEVVKDVQMRRLEPKGAGTLSKDPAVSVRDAASPTPCEGNICSTVQVIGEVAAAGKERNGDTLLPSSPSASDTNEFSKLSLSNTIYSPTNIQTHTRMPILEFILHYCRPEDAWQHFRLVDVWRGRIYSVFDVDHPLRFSSRNTFEESSLYRIEYLPLPVPVAGADRSPSVLPAFGGTSSPNETTPPHASHHTIPGRGYPNQTLINVYHFSQTRQRREVVETHSDPFSLFVAHDEYASQLLARIAKKLEIPMLTLQDWKLSFVKEKRVVAVNPDIPLGQQWASFCESCSVANGGGSPCAVDVCDTNVREPLKAPFLGLEHAKLNMVKGKQEKVVIRN